MENFKPYFKNPEEEKELQSFIENSVDNKNLEKESISLDLESKIDELKSDLAVIDTKMQIHLSAQDQDHVLGQQADYTFKNFEEKKKMYEQGQVNGVDLNSTEKISLERDLTKLKTLGHELAEFLENNQKFILNGEQSQKLEKLQEEIQDKIKQLEDIME